MKTKRNFAPSLIIEWTLLNEEKEKLCSIIDNRVDINKNSEADAGAVESDHEEKC